MKWNILLLSRDELRERRKRSCPLSSLEKRHSKRHFKRSFTKEWSASLRKAIAVPYYNKTKRSIRRKREMKGQSFKAYRENPKGAKFEGNLGKSRSTGAIHCAAKSDKKNLMVSCRSCGGNVHLKAIAL